MSNIELRKPGAFTMDGGFNIKNSDPVDSRTYVNDISHIYLPENWEGLKPYPGLIVSDPNGEIRICVNSNYTATTSWLVVRTSATTEDDNTNTNNGIGTIVVDKYENALEYATTDNIGLFIYITSAGNYNNNAYTAGPYVVSGENVLVKINITDYTNLITGATYSGNSVVSNNTIILDNFITTSGLSGYTYTKTEIDNKLKTIDLFSVDTELPTGDKINPSKIYLISNSGDSGNTFTEYIFVNTGTTEEPSYVSEIIGSLSVETDFSNYYDKDEIDGKLTTTTLTLTNNITGATDADEISSGTTLQNVFQNICDRIKNIKDNGGGSTGTITNLSGASGITVDLTADTPTISVNVNTATGNALEIKDDGSLYVESLVERLATLENLLSAFTGDSPATLVSSENIASAITNCISSENTGENVDIQVALDGDGNLKITLNSITNIAYNDAKPINNENGEN